MRRAGMICILLLVLLPACRPDPKSQAAEWAKRFPEEAGDWEADDDVLELTPENISNVGHVTLTYEGDEDSFAYISVDVYATETAAEVALAEKLRNWQLQGARFEEFEFEAERGTPLFNETIDIAAFPGGRLAYRQEKNTLFTLSVIPAEPSEVPDEAFIPLLETIVRVIVLTD